MREARSNDPVKRFIAIAIEFCRSLEKKHRSKRAFAERALRMTVDLYGSALDLPDTEPESDYSPLGEWGERNKHLPIAEKLQQDPQIRAHSERYQRVRKSVAANLGGDQRT